MNLNELYKTNINPVVQIQDNFQRTRASGPLNNQLIFKMVYKDSHDLVPHKFWSPMS